MTVSVVTVVDETKASVAYFRYTQFSETKLLMAVIIGK